MPGMDKPGIDHDHGNTAEPHPHRPPAPVPATPCGGASAVVPAGSRGAVETFGWLTPVHMIDGLALGETTPGPLIMVVAFVGFVGGWTKALFGATALPLAGIVAATVVTYFTFLPSFLFILAGGPRIESSRGELRLSAPLTAVQADREGVSVNRAAFFAGHRY